MKIYLRLDRWSDNHIHSIYQVTNVVKASDVPPKEGLDFSCYKFVSMVDGNVVRGFLEGEIVEIDLDT